MKPWVRYFLVGLIAFIVGVAAAGGSDTTGPSTTTVTETQSTSAGKAETITRTVTHRVRVRPKPKPQQQQATTYSGNGGKSLGTLRFPNGATLKWIDDGGLMQILTEGPDPVPVNSQGRSGETELAPGVYPQFQINSAGNWTIRIIQH